ncbi:MAG: cysteine rich repeat-containing protein [Candidatus Tectomicrobia bacterium]|nr:cysteine rich repeat-containing protein [Candidatus Tectomicrobia bacterium]
MSSWQKALSLPAVAVALGMFFVLLAILYLPAFAQARVCADDAAKFCPNAKGIQGRMQCLKEHEAELSPQCQARVQTMATRAKEMSDACQSDVQRFCQDVAAGGGRLARCLQRHESELSSTCKDVLAQARSKRQPPR